MVDWDKVVFPWRNQSKKRRQAPVLGYCNVVTEASLYFRRPVDMVPMVPIYSSLHHLKNQKS